MPRRRPLWLAVFRAAQNSADYDHLVAGTHRGSINHNTGDPEGALSVSHSSEFPTDFMYLVKGDRVGTGTDWEPLLDPATAKPASDLMGWSKFKDMEQAAQQSRVQELGLSQDEYRALAAGHKRIIPAAAAAATDSK
jgi:hypothetical protein